jgi:hypothetical protein
MRAPCADDHHFFGLVLRCGQSRDATFLKEAPIDDLMPRRAVESAESGAADVLSASEVRLESFILDPQSSEPAVERLDCFQMNTFRGVPEGSNAVEADTVEFIVGGPM